MGEDGRRCRRCGSHLARDHQDDEWCDPCLELRRFYDPTADPHFVLSLLAVLQHAQGERVEPVKALGLEPQHGRIVKAAVRSLRRQGHEIHSCGERCTGYRYVGQAVVTSTRGASVKVYHHKQPSHDSLRGFFNGSEASSNTG